MKTLPQTFRIPTDTVTLARALRPALRRGHLSHRTDRVVDFALAELRQRATAALRAEGLIT